MNCRKARAHFSSYLEQEMSELERRAMAAHLNRCPQCSSDLFATQKAISLLRWIPRPQGSPDFTERVLERIHAEKSREANPGWLSLQLDDFRQRCRELGAALAAPAPAGALVAALLIGGGGGALLVRMAGFPNLTRGPVLTEAPSIAATTGVRSSDPTTASRPESGSSSTALMMGPPAPSVSPASGGVSAGAGREAANLPGGVDGGPPMKSLAESAPAGGPGSMTAPLRMASSSPRHARPEAGTSSARLARAVTASRSKEGGVEVAEWASGAKRIEGLPEGPPAITRIEYVLDQVDVNRMPAPRATQVQEGSITF